MNFDDDLEAIEVQSGTLTIIGSGAVIVPIGSTAERPNSPGALRLNEDTGLLEYHNGSIYVSGGGQVNTVSITTANGFTGTSSGGSSPSLTISTTVSGLIKGLSNALVQAVAATDYVAPSPYASANGLTLASQRLLGRTSGAVGQAEEVSLGRGLTFNAQTLVGSPILNRWYGSIASASGTTRINPGTSPPLSTAGTQLFSQVVTPLANSSLFTLTFSVSVSTTSSSPVTVALFRDTTYLASAVLIDTGATSTKTTSIVFTDNPNTTSPVTYQVRLGNTTGTWYVNRRSADNTYGGLRSGWFLDEWEP